MNAISAKNRLDTLAHLPRWVGWRNEGRGGDVTKVPYSPATGFKARADDPATWSTRDRALTWARQHVNGQGGGIGIELGDLGNGTALGGVDLDTCRDAEGIFADWATDVLEALGGYSEVSPSGTGAKVFFGYDAGALPTLRAAMGTDHGKSWKRGRGKHAPAIELHLANRYFTVTGQQLEGTPGELRQVPTETLLQLIRVTGPAFAGPAKKPAGQQPGMVAAAAGLPDRIAAEAAQNPLLARRWAGDWSGLQDGSRSGQAMALTAALKRAGLSYADTSAALRLHPDTAEWTREKGEAAGGRELRRMFDAAGDGAMMPPDPGILADPDMSVLRLHRREPPMLPMQVFGSRWAAWIAATSESAACPADYVAGPLLAAASCLIGNARWAEAWPGWQEPPHLWTCSVGDSGGGKSPGADTLLRDVLPAIERRMGAEFPERRREWQAACELAKAAQEAWQGDVRTAQKSGHAAPLPPEKIAPPEPQAPRIRVNDVTIERVATLLASAAPKGLLIHRDELLGWVAGMNAYHDAGRAFWIEAYGGRPYRVERQKHPDPIDVPRLAVAACGGTQPAKLATLLHDADDGLLARIVWFWPDPVPFAMGNAAAGDAWATEALDRLRLLDLSPGDAVDMPGRPVPVPLDAAVRGEMVAFGREMQERQEAAGGLLRSALAKARGLALRLALVLEYLWWAGEVGMTAPPASIGREAFAAAAHLVADYLIPMAERVYGDATTRPEDRQAATLARWIIRTRPPEVHVRTLQRDVRLPGLGTAETIHAAAKLLAEAGWLLPPTPGTQQHRGRAAYPVNPRVYEVQP